MQRRAATERARLVVLQSCPFAGDPERRPGWLSRCQDSVRRWAERAGHDYHLEGDELFARKIRVALEGADADADTVTLQLRNEGATWRRAALLPQWEPSVGDALLVETRPGGEDDESMWVRAEVRELLSILIGQLAILKWELHEVSSLRS